MSEVIGGGVSTVTIEDNVVKKKYKLDENNMYYIITELLILNLLDGTEGFPRVLDVVNEDPYYTIVMPYLGRPLCKVKDPIDIFTKILHKVAILHKHDIAHVDLKPNNILIDDKNNVSIIDFSHSCLLCRSQDTGVTPYVFGTVGGHYDYMAPEVYKDAIRPTTSLDVWSLGCIFYEMLTGCILFHDYSEVKEPYKSCYLVSVMDKHKNMDIYYKKIDSIEGHDEEKKMIKAMLQLDHNKRPSVTDLLGLITHNNEINIRQLYDSNIVYKYRESNFFPITFPSTIYSYINNLMEVFTKDENRDLYRTCCVLHIMLKCAVEKDEWSFSSAIRDVKSYMSIFLNIIKNNKMSLMYKDNH
jgi:serine/threonine protein kinase